MSTAESLEDRPLPRMTVEEYLEFEAKSEFRHDYDHGVVTPVGGSYAMAGGSPEHSQVKSDLMAEIIAALRPKGCSYFDSDMRVDIGSGLYVYPDATATCSQPEYTGSGSMRSLKNPKAVFEVLSESTEADDRGKKLKKYFAIPSVQDYVLVNVATPRIEVISRDVDADEPRFVMTFADGLDAKVRIPSLDVSLSLAEIYRQVAYQEGPTGELELIVTETETEESTDEPSST